MNDLQSKDLIRVNRGSVAFAGYEALKAQAKQVAEIIKSADVSEHTIKEAKRMLASANKAVKELESRRIAIKKEILSPYDEFEAQVKEIVGIVKDAETQIRSKVRELEDQERQDKEEALREIWELRFRPYKTELRFLQFEDWLKPQHLNKTYSMSKAEEDMAHWLEGRRQDVRAIMGMEAGIEILSEYKQCIDLSLAVATVQERALRLSEIAAFCPKVEETTQKTILIIEDAKDAKLAEMILKENNIRFKKEIC